MGPVRVSLLLRQQLVETKRMQARHNAALRERGAAERTLRPGIGASISPTTMEDDDGFVWGLDDYSMRARTKYARQQAQQAQQAGALAAFDDAKQSEELSMEERRHEILRRQHLLQRMHFLWHRRRRRHRHRHRRRHRHRHRHRH